MGNLPTVDTASPGGRYGVNAYRGWVPRSGLERDLGRRGPLPNRVTLRPDGSWAAKSGGVVPRKVVRSTRSLS